MPVYFFRLGRNPDLSLYELQGLIRDYAYSITAQNKDYVVIQAESEIDLASIQDKAGGIIKCGLVLDAVQHKDELKEKIKHNIFAKGKLGISFSRELSDLSHSLPITLKKELQSEGLKVQVILPKEYELNSAQIIHNKLTTDPNSEINCFKIADTYYIGKTVAVQDIELWSKIEFDKPKARAKEGMLPSKVARMMLNIAVSNLPQREDITILDPFCGTGTVLMEAMRSGYKAIGADNAEEAIQAANENTAWLAHMLDVDQPTLHVQDVTHIDQVLPAQSVDAVVTEPFMGTNFEKAPTPGKAERVVDGLERLYKGALKSIHKTLKKGGIIVMIVPTLRAGKKTYSTSIIDNLAQYGYTLVHPGFEYARPGAIVVRKIFVAKRS